MIVMALIAAESAPSSLPEALVSYGIAFPFALVCLAIAKWAIADRDKRVAAAVAERDAERARTEALTQQLIEVQGQALPLLSEAAAVIRVTSRGVG